MGDPGVPRWGEDPDAFEAFYREQIDAVENFVTRRVGDRELAADLTADIFVASIESAGTYDAGRGTPTAWLFGIARVVVASRFRRTERERRATARLRGRELLELDETARIDDRIAAHEQSRLLFAAIERLPAGERAVLELVALDELSIGEAASALGVSDVTARVRLYRARRRMTRELGASGAEEGALVLMRPKETSS